MKNKFLITIDGIRKDRIGIYNNQNSPLTKNLNEIARKSVVFDDMFASATSTGMCFSSIFTGKMQKDFGRKKYGDNVNPFHENIFNDHEKIGYKTIVCLNERFRIHHRLINAFSDAEHLWTGFKDKNKNLGSLRPLEQVEYLSNYLKNVDKPVFVWLHLWGFSAPKEKFLGLTNFDYDQRVAELDEAIGYAFEKFSKNSEMYFFADHGYAFFENNNWAYGSNGENLSNSVCSVPFIAYKNGETGTNKNLVSQLRIREIINSEKGLLDFADEIAFCETRYINQGDRSLSIRVGDFKYNYYYFTNTSELYDLKSDPYENVNYVSKAFHKISRDIEGSHEKRPPYIIRNDWKEIQNKIQICQEIAKDFYKPKYSLLMMIKETLRRNKVIYKLYKLIRS